MPQNLNSESTQITGNPQTNQLIEVVNRLILPLGYEAVHVEVQTHRQKVLRLFIDFAQESKTAIGIEDCVAVTRALDEPLDQVPEIEAIFHGAYELEVSSPGVDRPLRQAKDFLRFAGSEVRIHTFRPLSAEEVGNSAYFAKNPKQKNFFGTLKGIDADRVLLTVSDGPSAQKGKSKRKLKTNKEQETESKAAEIRIPLPLISKANIEPRFEIGEED